MSYNEKLLHSVMHCPGGDLTGKQYEASLKGNGCKAPGSGGGMPEGGTPFQQLVTDGEGNTVWADRLAYDAGTSVETLLDLTFEGTGEDNYNTMALSSPVETEFIEGETYTVMWNGTAYKCVAKKTVVSDDVYAFALGGEGLTPFGILIYNQLYMKAYGVIVSYDNAVSVPVSILHETENIKKVDPKFLPEGIGYETEGGGEVLPENELMAAGDEQLVSITPFTNPLAIGDNCIVTWNGKEYQCTAQAFEEDGVVAPALGNMGAVTGGVNTGEPFILIDFSLVSGGEVSVMAIALDGAASVTLSITKTGSIHRIPEKYLPAIAGALTITADFDVSSVTISNLSHTYEQARDAFVEGKEVRLLLKAVGNEKTNYYALPAIILDEDNSGTNKMLSFQLVMYALDQSVSVSYNGLTGEAEVTLG